MFGSADVKQAVDIGKILRPKTCIKVYTIAVFAVGDPYNVVCYTALR